MAYSLYIDKNENFECDVSVKNATLKNSIARLIVKSDNINLMFEGNITGGRCIIPICKMKGILNENTTGKMQLEIIVDDTYFSPWKDNFIVEEHTSVKVHVHEQKKEKPSVNIINESINRNQKNIDPSFQILYLMERFGINKSNLINRKKDVSQIIKEYFLASPEHIKNGKKYIRGAFMLLK